VDIGYAELPVLTLAGNGNNADPISLLYTSYSEIQKSRLSEERNSLLPDITLSVFNGTNHYAGSKNYFGYQAGLALPLFFGGQRAKIKSARIEYEIAITEEENLKLQLASRKAALKDELEKYSESVNYFTISGSRLATEIYRTAQKSYQNGDIDFFRFIQSLETATEIELNYLDNLAGYNRIILDLNYLTLN